MLQKHRQVLILLVGLLYVYSVCPLLCATVEQKFCKDGPQKTLNGVTETYSCCQGTKTAAADKADTPSESGKSCCSSNLELVLPDDRHNTPEARELIGQSLVSMLPISTTLPVAPQESFEISSIFLAATLFPDHPLTRRGPPFTEC